MTNIYELLAVPTQPPASKISDPVKEIKQNVINAGHIEFDRETTLKLLEAGFAPEDIDRGVITTGINLYSMGINSTKILESIENNKSIDQNTKNQLYRCAIIASAFEDSFPQEHEKIRQELGYPELSISSANNIPAAPKENAFYVDFSNNTFTSSVQNISGIAVDKAKKIITDKTLQALKPGLDKITSSFAQKAVSKGVGEAAKKAALAIGGKIGTKLATHLTANLVAPGVGTLIVLAAELAIKAIKKIGRVLSKLFASLTGIQNPKDQIATLFIAGGAGMFLIGAAPVALALIGTGTVIAFTAPASASVIVANTVLFFHFLSRSTYAMIKALLINTLVAIIIIITFFIFSYTVIQMGAYVVPPGGFGTETEMGVRGQFRPGEIDPGIPPDPDFPRDGSLPAQTLYINMSKQSNQTSLNNNSGNQPVTYTVTINAPRADITLQEMVCTNSLYGSGTPPEGSEPNVRGVSINKNGTYTITYTTTINTDTINDALLVDRCCVVANTEGSRRGACADARVIIGNYPNCITSAEFPGIYNQNVQQSINTILASSPEFVATVCSCGDWCRNNNNSTPDVKMCPGNLPGSQIGSHSRGHQCSPGCDVILDPSGLYSSNAIFLIAHELTHHIQACNTSATNCFLTYPGLREEGFITAYAAGSGQRRYIEDMAETAGYYFGNRELLATRFPNHLRAFEHCVLGIN